jgi:hypothetical protein
MWTARAYICLESRRAARDKIGITLSVRLVATQNAIDVILPLNDLIFSLCIHIVLLCDFVLIFTTCQGAAGQPQFLQSETSPKIGKEAESTSVGSVPCVRRAPIINSANLPRIEET